MKGAGRMMTSMTAMPMFADASFAPACQSAPMTNSCAVMMDTALLAVSFLFGILLVLSVLVVRIILPNLAKP